MTTKQIAEMTGKSGQTVRRIAKKLYPDKFKTGAATDFSEPESIEIVKRMRFLAEQDVKIKPQQSVEVLQHSVELRQVVAEIVKDVLAALLPAMISQTAQPKQIESRFATAVAYCNQNGLPRDFDSVKSLAYRAAVYSKAHGLPIQKVADERWGYVNTYTREALDAARFT